MQQTELLPFATAWMELESIMLSEISQAVKDKYYMTSPLTGTQSTKQTNKQNITKDTEIEKRPTVTRRERGGNFRGKGEGFVGTIIKDTWTITGGRVEMGGRWGGLGGWAGVGRKCR